MKIKNPALKLYVKATSWFLAVFISIVLVFAPILPAALGLWGIDSFLGMDMTYFTGTKEQSYVNILLMGLDKDETRSDVMMVAQLNMISNSVNILQIPRDTYIQTKRYDKKINSAYGAGGPESSIDAVESITGLDIDKYAIVTTSGFRDVIDVVGGVYYDVPRDMDYDDDYQDLHIHLKKGYQLLDGDKAEQYVRCRNIYPSGDLGRIEAQSGFIKAAMEQIIQRFTNESDVDIEKLLTALGDMVDTNFTLGEMLKYSPYILNINMDNVNIMMIDGEARYQNGASYFFADKSGIERQVSEYFTPDISEADLSEVNVRDSAIGKNREVLLTADAPEFDTPNSDVLIYIMDYSGTDGEALDTMKEKLIADGYRIDGTISAKTIISEETYCIGEPDSLFAAKVARSLGLEKYYINHDYSHNADVIIILGKEE
ncbi:MAG: LCP family protein [Clostridia bacterium]|nr:LCP family protein [Clostridia bacterium]